MKRLEPVFGSIEVDKAMAEAAASAAAGEIASREYFAASSDSVHYTDQPQWVKNAISKQEWSRSHSSSPATPL